MKDLIKALIENDKPFGLMSAEMQAKAIEIGLLDNFRMYTGSITGEWGGIFKATWCKFRCDVTYCLRADYQEKADIDERLVMLAGAGLVCVSAVLGKDNLLLSECINQPDFIGFKYEADGVVISAYARGYRRKDSDCIYYGIKTKDIADYEVLTPIAVLFQRSK